MEGNILRIGAFLAVVTAGFISAGIAVGSGGPPAGDDHKVTICHKVNGNGNTGNGYNLITVDKDSIANKDGSFNGHGLDLEDIIPAFAAGSKGNQEWGAFPGRGDASWIGNNCAAPGDPDPTEPDPTEPDPTEPDPTEPDPTVTDPTVPDPTVPDETVPPPFECPNGEEPIHGTDTTLDGQNDSCDPCAPPVNLEKCPPPATPTPEVTPPVEGGTPPAAVTPPTVTKPKPTKPKTAKKPKPKIVSVKPGKKPGTVVIKTSDGKTHVGVQGSG